MLNSHCKSKRFRIKVAVIYGTKSAKDFIEKIKRENEEYHFIEVMTCPGGCIGGGGQPKGILEKGDALREKRIEGLYSRDRELKRRRSDENKELMELYEKFYEKPLSELAKYVTYRLYR